MTIALALAAWLFAGQILNQPHGAAGSRSDPQSATALESGRSPLRILDVPFIQQSEALCGGAAVAMVMRFWGASDVNAESFAALIDQSAGGIHGDDLLRDVGARGWDARSFGGDRVLVTQRLADRQPVIALIEDRPGSYHFVVIVGWANGRVIYHDPARAPFRVLQEDRFEEAWQKSNRWTMLLLPPPAGVPSLVVDDTPRADRPKMPCDELVAEGVRAAEEGDRSGAREIFTAAAALCPAASGPLRESAGLAALDGDWTEAERLARAAIARDRSDTHAWRIAATAAYLRDDPASALDAWNRAGEPLVDLVNVSGLGRTRHAVATSVIGLEPGALLTSAALAVARQRLRELPSAEIASVSYKPLGSGRTTVEAVVTERPVVPRHRSDLVAAAIRLGIDRELAIYAASPSGNGELFRASWRWWEGRPRYELEFLAPSPAGIWRVAAFAEKQTYGAAATSATERRRGGHISLAQWTRTLTRWQVGAGIDTWNGDERTASIAIAVDQRLLDDRVSMRVAGSIFAGGFDARTTNLEADWRSRTRHEGIVVLAGAGWNAVTSAAPQALWAGAGAGHGRDPLLRAHPLFDDGRIDSEIFGRQLLYTTTEARRWSKPLFAAIRLAPAVFVDLARADGRMQSGSAWHADAGIGLRVALPAAGVLRIDLAKGLRDGSIAVSFGLARN